MKSANLELAVRQLYAGLQAVSGLVLTLWKFHRRSQIAPVIITYPDLAAFGSAEALSS